MQARSLSLWLAPLFLLFLTGMAFSGRLPIALLICYLAASLLTFLAYLLDKSAARSRRWRTPERTLHLLGLAGGWPGALLAQRLLRHKTGKRSFQLVFWCSVLVNCGALVWLFTPSGSRLLHTLLQTP